VKAVEKAGGQTGDALSARQGVTATAPGTNPLLQNFLDSDKEGDVDMQGLVRLGSKLLQ
jgi:hypothetical protein